MKLKRESPKFAPWDAMGMAAHLEQMEARGWRFRGPDALGRWEYTACTPNTARWAVAYAPSRRNWKIVPTQPERDLEDLCFDAGWRKITALDRFHIYRNADPNATPLETDERVRLDTLHRTLKGPLRNQALAWCIGVVLFLGLLLLAVMQDLPRLLALPGLPAVVIFCLWLLCAELTPWVLYARWHRAAVLAAESGLPCPVVKNWQLYSWISWIGALPLLLLIVTGHSLMPAVLYFGMLLVFTFLRWFLEHRVKDAQFAEDAWTLLMVVLFICVFCFHRWNSDQNQTSPKRDAIPLMAQDLMDTSGMELKQYDLNGNDGLLASYHDYVQVDFDHTIDIQYEVFDLRLPILWEVCREQYLESFHTVATRNDMTITHTDPAVWGAEQVLFSRKPGQDQWLLLYTDRIIQLHTNWNLSPEQILIAAEKLLP